MSRKEDIEESARLHAERYRVEEPAFANGYESHPAYAMVGVSRVSGQTNLFGSNIGHSGFIRLTISQARHSVSIGGSHESYSAGGQLVTVDMSEAQWAALVSRPNMGDGTPCTLRTIREPGNPLQFIPQLPGVKKAREKLESKAQAMIDEAQKKQSAAFDRMREILSESKMPAKVRDELLAEMGYAYDHGQTNRDYQRKVLTEDTERLTQEARIEIDAMLTGAVTRFGLASIEQLGVVLAADPKALLQLAHNPQSED